MKEVLTNPCTLFTLFLCFWLLCQTVNAVAYYICVYRTTPISPTGNEGEEKTEK